MTKSYYRNPSIQAKSYCRNQSIQAKWIPTVAVGLNWRIPRVAVGLNGLYPCSTKTREVLGNPSPTSKRFPETREISRGRSPREISRVEGNLEGGGDGFPNTSRVLVEYGQSLSINFSTGSGSENPSLWTGKD